MHQKKNNTSLSIVIPAYNEEKNIKPAIENAILSIKNLVSGYEIIAINDGSTDGTGKVLDRLAKKYIQVRVVHHRQNKGFGYTIKEGIQLARMEYITGLPGDNDTSPKLLSDLIKTKNQADMVIAYVTNPEVRSLIRRIISQIFVILMNLIFRLKLRYYNSYFIIRTKLLKDLPLVSSGLCIFAEAKVRLIKRGATYKEVPFRGIKRKYGKSSAITWKNFSDTIRMIVILIYDIYFQAKRNYNG